MQLQQFIPYFRQSIAQFIRLSTEKNQQEDIENVSKNVISLTKYDKFLEVAFYILIQYAETNNNFQNILISNLIKDKFKYEFQTIFTQNLNLYYNELVKIFLIEKTKSIRMQTSKAFFNNIELSLTYIFINIIAQKQESIFNFLSPIIPQDQSLANSYQANHYLKVLAFISSQIDDNKVVIDEKSRQNAKNRLIEDQINILVKLNDECPQLWNNYYLDKENIIRAFTFWVTLSYNETIYLCLPQHYLTDKLFQLLRDDDTIETGVQCIKYIINTSKSYEQNKGMFDLFLVKMKNVLAKQTQKLILNRQFTIAQQYVDVIISISQKLCVKYVQQIKEHILFVKTIAQLSLYRSIDLSNAILNFWQTFFDEVYKYLNLNNNQMIELFQLLAGFCYQRTMLKCQFSKSEIQKLQIQDESSLKKLKEIFTVRNDAQDLLINISKVIGINNYLNLVASKINEQINKQTLQWQKVQVYYFSLLIKPIENFQKISLNDNNDKIGEILNYYYQLNEKQNLPINFDHRHHYIPIAMKRTFLKFLKFIMKIKDLDEIIVRQSIVYSQINFSNNLLSNQAERTFSKICESKSYVFIDHLQDIINLIDKYPMKSLIISGIFNLICGKSQNIELFLYNTFQKVYTKVISLLNSPKNNGQSLLCLISCARTILQNKIIRDHLEIVKRIFTLIWPLIQNTLINPQNIQDDEDIGIERIAKLLKFFMRCLKEDFSQFLAPLFESIEKGFSKYPVCSYLYIFQVAIPLFSNNPDHQNQVLQFYKYLFLQTSNYFQSIDLQRYILLLEDFIGMNKKLFMCNASLVSKSLMFEQLLNMCYYFIFHQNIKVSRAAYSYFEAIFMVYWRSQFIEMFNKESNQKSEQIFFIENKDTTFYSQFKESLLPQVPNLLSKAFYHLSQCPHEATREYILQCIYSQIKAFNIQNLEVWAKVLNDFPPQIMLNNEKQDFFNRLSSLNNDSLTDISKSMQQIKRLLNLISKRYTYAFKRANIKLYP